MNQKQAQAAISELTAIASYLLYHEERWDDRERAAAALRRLRTECADDAEWSKRAEWIWELFSSTPLFSSNPKKHHGVQSGYEEIVQYFEHLPKISN